MHFIAADSSIFHYHHKDFALFSSSLHGRTVVIVTQPQGWKHTRTYTQWNNHKSNANNTYLFMNLLSKCSRSQDTSISQLFQWVSANMDQWRDDDGEETQSRRKRGDERKGEEEWGGLEGWKEWKNTLIFSNITCSVFEAWCSRWAEVDE